jgi:hypothetical protein
LGKEKSEVAFDNNAGEIYFEENDMDGFLEKLKNIGGIHYVHGVKEQPWGQRAVTFYDRDGHIIEVGENMKTVAKRFYDNGMTAERIAERMGIPLKNVKFLLK